MQLVETHISSRLQGGKETQWTLDITMRCHQFCAPYELSVQLFSGCSWLRHIASRLQGVKETQWTLDITMRCHQFCAPYHTISTADKMCNLSDEPLSSTGRIAFDQQYISFCREVFIWLEVELMAFAKCI